MGFHASSTRRSTATSAVSNQAVVINSGNTAPAGSSAYTIAGAVSANTALTIGVVTPGQSSSNSSVASSSGPIIANVQYLDANNTVITGANAVSTAGGNILVNGSNFVTNSSVYLNNSLATNTFINSSQIRVIGPAASAGNVTLMIFSPTNTGTLGPNVRYSGVPTWTTAAVSFQNGAAANVALVASSDSTITFTLQAGSTLPTGISLQSAGYLVGTATGYSVNTSSTAVIVATDQEGQAAQQTLNITVTVSDPQFNYTTLLLNGETSVTPFIADASTNNFGLTIAGDTRADKFSPYYGNGYYSFYIPGNTGFIASIPSAAGNLGAGNFTIEMWMNTDGITYSSTLLNAWSYNSNFSYEFYINGSSLQFYDGSNVITSSSGVLKIGVWYHIAAVRNGSTITLYLNGVSVASGSSAVNFAPASAVGIGGTDSGQAFGGYISNLRIVRGTALYTSTFTPSTTPLTAISGTILLTAQSSRFIDTSANAYAVTQVSSSSKITPAIPFAASSSYATYGSQYCLTTASYLTVSMGATQAFGTGDFTVECWVYNTASAHNICMAATNTTTWELLTYGSQLYWHENGSNLGGTGYGTIILNSWSHFAVSRASGTLRMFINGVQVYSAANSYNYSNNSTARYIGPANGGTAGQYVADFRVINGTGLYTTAFTPPTTPLSAVANTQLLTCQYNGGANNYGIIDNGPFDYIITRTGNATQGTFSPFSATGWSNYFNGSTDYIYAASNAAFAFGTGDYTVEFWVYSAIAFSGTICFYNNNSGGYFLQYATGTGLQTGVAGSSSTGTYAVTLSPTTWNHIAISRASGSSKCFVNGSQVGSTVSDSTNYAQNGAYIGALYNGTQGLNGYISNLRILKGTALYTANFTPSTTPLTAIANTQLLTCQSNRFKDNSTNAFTLTTAGTPSVQAYSPFAPANSYAPATNGGSCFFDGVGDYLTLTEPAAVAAGTDVTVELWVYPTTAFSTRNFLVTAGTSAAGAWGISIETTGSVGIWVDSFSAARITTTTTLSLNTWYHIALVKSSGTIYAYINGVRDASTYAQSGGFGQTQAITVGAYNVNKTQLTYGYITDVRYIRGTAIYTGATATVPTAPLTSPTATPASVLLNFTNGGLVDAHASGVSETVGNAQLSTAVKKYGTASMSFNGSSQYLSIPYNVLYALESCDFTVEAWVYRNAIGSEHNIAVTRSSGGNDGWNLRINAANTITFYYTGASSLSSTGTIPATTWTHVAVTKSGNTVRLFINGTIDGSNASFGTGNANTQPLRIGVDNSNAAGWFNGYIDDLRITRGYARYTANFTPPSSAFLGQ